MVKAYHLFILTLFIPLLSGAQADTSNAYLLRKHMEKDSFWRVQNTGFYYIQRTGMKENHFGWFGIKELQEKATDLFYFEANTLGSVRLVLELAPGTTSILLDTVPVNQYQLINHFYGYARRDFERKNNTVDILSGALSFTPAGANQLIIDGTINIDTKAPVTHQSIVFNKYAYKIITLDEILDIQRRETEKAEKLQQQQWQVYQLIASERKRFYDSVFNKKNFPGNDLRAKINGKTPFHFTLNNSYILVNAHVTDSAKQDLSELLGGNIMASLQGDKTVLVLHSFYDPIKNAIDDETNYSMTIEADTLIAGKTYNANELVAKLAYWHYGPGGSVIASRKATGTLTIIVNNEHKTTGMLALIFENSDKSQISVEGGFDLPKIKISDISDLENNIRIKVNSLKSSQ